MNETKKQLKKHLDSHRKCLTCGEPFSPKRSDSKYCKRLCYRRNITVAKRYSDKTNAYQKAHSKEPKRRFQKLQYKYTHYKLPLSIDLTTYLTLITNKCEYCQKSLTEETGCSLDRIDHTQGYHSTNVVPCCGSCNQIRNIHLTFDEMKVAMNAVVKYRNGQAIN